jgi:hypothetical protein
METISKQVQEIMQASYYSYHPSREDEIRISRLEQICILLAREIDNINKNNS